MTYICNKIIDSKQFTYIHMHIAMDLEIATPYMDLYNIILTIFNYTISFKCCCNCKALHYINM